MYEHISIENTFTHRDRRYATTNKNDSRLLVARLAIADSHKQISCPKTKTVNANCDIGTRLACLCSNNRSVRKLTS